MEQPSDDLMHIRVRAWALNPQKKSGAQSMFLTLVTKDISSGRPSHWIDVAFDTAVLQTDTITARHDQYK